MKRHASGFTLIEMLTVVTVMAVLLAVAVPALQGFTARNQVSASHSALMASLAYARTEAARRGVAVFFVAEPGASVGNEYANGWAVFVDRDGDGVHSKGDAPALRQHEALHQGVVVHGSAMLTFQPNGALSPVAAKTFRVCRPTAGTTGYEVIVGPSGLSDAGPLSVNATSDCSG